MLLRCHGKNAAECIHKLLVGRADTDSLFQSLFRKRKGGLLSSHGLTDHADLRIIQDDVKIMHYAICIRRIRKISEIQNVLYMDALRKITADLLLVLINDLGNAASHRAKSEYCNFNHTVLPCRSLSARFIFPAATLRLPESSGCRRAAPDFPEVR